MTPEDRPVIVVGGGAVGLAAALAASQTHPTVVIEASGRIGGAAAASSGVLWVPNHHRMDGIERADSRAEALAYLEATGAPDPYASAFVDRVCDLVRTLEQRSDVVFRSTDEPDAQLALRGAKRGRHLAPSDVSLRHLGEWRRFLDADVTSSAWRRLRARATGGRALVASLLDACLRAGVGLRPNTRALALLDDAPEPGVHVRAERPGGSLADFELRGPIVLASGAPDPTSRWAEHLGALTGGPPTLPVDPSGRFTPDAATGASRLLWAAGDAARWSLDADKIAVGARLSTAMTSGFICGLEASRCAPALVPRAG